MKQNIFTLFTTKDDKNLAFHVTNDKNTVINNRKNLCKKYNLNYNNLKYMNQVHGNDVKIVKDDISVYECDALISNKVNTPLMVMVADCIPILFYDNINNVIAVAHAGRNGTYLNIISNVIQKMKNEFSCKASNIHIQLGPSIQQCCYEVSLELANIAKINFGEDIVYNKNVNLQKINYNQALKCGILKHNISISNICTKCNGKNYYSYRNNKQCGRFAGIIQFNYF